MIHDPDDDPEIAETFYWQRASRFAHKPGSGARDVRRGDRWLAFHFSEEFEARAKRGRECHASET